MAGASEQTRRVAFVNANWAASTAERAAGFELQVVTDDDVRHSVEVDAQDMTAVLAMTRASSVMLWDPQARTLIAANLAGEWIQPDWSTGEPRRQGPPHRRSREAGS